MNRQYGALSGVAIVLIVLNHAIHFGLQVAPVTGAWLGVLILLQALGSFAVPAFLFVSGAFLAYAARELSATFVRSSLERILWPYLLWSSIFYALIYTTTGEWSGVEGYVKDLVVGFPYHFVPLLVFWYLATPALVWIGRRHGALLVAGIAAWQAWLLAVRDPAIFGLDGRLPGWAAATAPPVLFTPMSDWAIYFPLGLVTSLHGTALKPHLERWRPAMAALTAVLFGLGMLNAFSWVNVPWARFAAAIPLMLVLPVIDRSSIPFLGFFERIGRRSYGIYLTHFVVINVVVLTLGRWLSGWPWLVYPSFLLVALGASLLLMDVVGRTRAGRRVYRYFFGIVPPAVAPRRAA